MIHKPLVLLIEDNPVDTLLIKDILVENGNGFYLESFISLSDGLEYLKNHTSEIEVVLLDLSLPDSQGLGTFSQVHNLSPAVPIVILTSLDDEAVSIRALQEGAQDYLIKGQVSGPLLIRSLQYAIQRKQTEQKLAESLEFNQKILEASASGILTYKSSGQCVYANAAAAKILGATIPELLEQNFHNLASWKNCGLYELSMEVLKTGVSDQNEIQICTSFKQDLWLECHITSFNNGRENHLMLIFNDITSRKKMESALEWEQYLLQSLLETHPDCIFFKDRDGKYLRISKAFALKMGFADPGQLIGKTDFDLFSNENATLFSEYESMIMETGMPMVNQEMKETFANKGIAWSLATKIPLLDKEGKIIGTFGISHDITERKQFEEALTDSQKRYKSLFDDSPTPMWEEDFSTVKTEIDLLKESGITDFPDFFEKNPEVVKTIIRKVRVIDINKAVLKLHNAYSKDEIRNDVTCVFTEETYKAIAFELIMIAQGRRTFDFNQEVRTIDNKIRYVIIRWSAASGYELSLKRVLISIIDITEHKLAEAALRESESMLNEAQKVAHIGSWTLDPESGEMKWSNELFDIYGLSPRQNAPDLNGHKRFFKAKEWEKFSNHLQQLKADGDAFEIELNFIRSDNERHMLLSKGRLKNQKNGKSMIVGTSQDITDIKKVEKELRVYREYLEEMIEVRTQELEGTKQQNELILNAVGDGIFGIDLEGRITFINPAAAQMLGWEIEEILGQKNDKAIPVTKHDGAHYPDTESPIYLTTRDGQTRRVFDELFRDKNGVEFPTEYLCTPIWENNRLIGAVVVFSNITEQKQAAEALEKAKEAAEKATRAKSEFLANMSHEIRTPMNAIIGFADLLAVSVKDEKQRSQVDSIRHSAKNLLTIINDILDLSKIEAGKLKFEYEPMDIRNLVKDIENIFAQKISEKGLSFIIDLPGDFPGTIIIDEIRLRQVLFNLIGNAIKFTTQGFVKLVIRHMQQTGTDKNSNLFISVEDTGIGIRKEQQQVIFEAFNQQIGQSSKKYGGTGLGLTITKRLVEMMGGSISIQSQPGKGSIFEINIPGLKYSEQTIVKKDEKTFDPASIIFKNGKVLICDDNPSDRTLISDLLENYPLTLFLAENGKMAIELATENQPDVILMDLKMPEMSGAEAAKILKGSPATQSIPIIVISASVRMNTLKEEVKNTFDDFLLKPINLLELVDSLKKFLPYTMVGKETGFEDLLMKEITLTPEQMTNLPQVIGLLEQDFAKAHGEIMQEQKIGQMEAFGDKLIDLGEKHELPLISQYGNNIKTMATNFDIEKLLTLLNLFPKVIEKLNKLRG